MAQKHTLEELNNCSREELITIVLMMQGQLDASYNHLFSISNQRITKNYSPKIKQSIKNDGL